MPKRATTVHETCPVTPSAPTPPQVSGGVEVARRALYNLDWIWQREQLGPGPCRTVYRLRAGPSLAK
eukprot:COSAG01_NODE_4623_length_4868_cov_3.974837_3_plen_67_part_00